MHTEISFLSISSQSSTDVVCFQDIQCLESICSPLFTALRTICTNRILQITTGVAGLSSTATPAFNRACSLTAANRTTEHSSSQAHTEVAIM